MNFHAPFHIFRYAWIGAFVISLLPQYLHIEITFDGILLSIALALGYAVGFALNNYFDANLDRQDPQKARKNFFAYSEPSKFILLLILLSIGIYFVYVALLFGTMGFLSLIILSFVVWSYSAEPIKFKRRLGFDIFIHSIFVQTLPYLITVYLLDFGFEDYDQILILILIMSSAAGQIGGQLRDYNIDEKTHRTSTHIIGYQKAKKLYYLLILGITTIFTISMFRGILQIVLIPLGTIGFLFVITRPLSSDDEERYDNRITVILGVLAIIYLIGVIGISLYQNTYWEYLAETL